jgi:hypothetical protein
MQNTTQRPAEASGIFTIGGDLKVYRLGFGTMRLRRFIRPISPMLSGLF